MDPVTNENERRAPYHLDQAKIRRYDERFYELERQKQALLKGHRRRKLQVVLATAWQIMKRNLRLR